MEERDALMEIVVYNGRRNGTTLIMIEHDMDIMRRFVHRVIAFYQGEIICDAPPEQALESEHVRKYIFGGDGRRHPGQKCRREAIQRSDVAKYVVARETQRTEWLRQQSNPRLAALLMSEEGRAGMRLAEAGVARLLAKCNGRGSWRVQDGYCVPMRPDGRPDGFKLGREGA